MDPLAESLEKDARAAGVGPPSSWARVEIGPRDLPEPAGGYVDLVLDEGEPPSSPGGESAFPPLSGAPPPGERTIVPNEAPLEAGSARRFRDLPRGEAGNGSGLRQGERRRWLLVPEVLVVVGFLLAGAMVATALHLVRAPGPATALATPTARALAPRSHGGGRASAPVGAGVITALPARVGAWPGATAAEEDEAPPVVIEAPVDPEPPPAPSVAPWSGGG